MINSYFCPSYSPLSMSTIPFDCLNYVLKEESHVIIIPSITDDLNKGTNHSLDSNILLSLRPILKYPGLKFWFRFSALCTIYIDKYMYM